MRHAYRLIEIQLLKRNEDSPERRGRTITEAGQHSGMPRGQDMLYCPAPSSRGFR